MRWAKNAAPSISSPTTTEAVASAWPEAAGAPGKETEPRKTVPDFIRDLRAASPTFARLWAQGDVAAVSTRTKLFRHAGVGELRMSATNLSAPGMPEARIVIYTPQDEQSREAMTRLLAEPGLSAAACACDAHAAAGR